MGQLALLQRLDEDRRLLIELSGAAARCSHFDSVAKLGVVNRIHAFLLGDDGHKAVTPQDLLCHVGGSRLCRDASSFYNPFQYHDELQVLEHQVRSRDVVKRTPLVYDVANDQGSYQENVVAFNGVIHGDIHLVNGYDFSFRGCCLPHDLDSHGGADDHALPQVPHPEHEAELAVADGDDCLSAEDQRLSPPVSLSCLHEYAAQHDSVDDQPHNVLQDQDCDGQGTFLSHHPAPKADGHLNFNGEEESGGERPVGEDCTQLTSRTWSTD